jgi:hypothetical protein
MDKLGVGSRNVEVYTKVSMTLNENLVYFTEDRITSLDYVYTKET